MERQAVADGAFVRDNLDAQPNFTFSAKHALVVLIQDQIERPELLDFKLVDFVDGERITILGFMAKQDAAGWVSAGSCYADTSKSIYVDGKTYYAFAPHNIGEVTINSLLENEIYNLKGYLANLGQAFGRDFLHDVGKPVAGIGVGALGYYVWSKRQFWRFLMSKKPRKTALRLTKSKRFA